MLRRASALYRMHQQRLLCTASTAPTAPVTEAVEENANPTENATTIAEVETTKPKRRWQLPAELEELMEKDFIFGEMKVKQFLPVLETAWLEKAEQDQFTMGFLRDYAKSALKLRAYDKVLQAADKFVQLYPQKRLFFTDHAIIKSMFYISKQDQDDPKYTAQDVINRFNEGQEKGTMISIPTYAPLIEAYCDLDQPEEAEKLLNEMKTKEIVPAARVIAILMTAYSKNPENKEKVMSLFKELDDRTLRSSAAASCAEALSNIGEYDLAFELLNRIDKKEKRKALGPLLKVLVDICWSTGSKKRADALAETILEMKISYQEAFLPLLNILDRKNSNSLAQNLYQHTLKSVRRSFHLPLRFHIVAARSTIKSAKHCVDPSSIDDIWERSGRKGIIFQVAASTLWDRKRPQDLIALIDHFKGKGVEISDRSRMLYIQAIAKTGDVATALQEMEEFLKVSTSDEDVLSRFELLVLSLCNIKNAVVERVQTAMESPESMRPHMYRRGFEVFSKQQNRAEEVKELYDAAVENEIRLREYDFSLAIQSCAQGGRLDYAIEILADHCNQGVIPSKENLRDLLIGCERSSRHGGKIMSLLELVKSMGCAPTVQTYNTAMRALKRHLNSGGVFEVYDMIKQENLELTADSYQYLVWASVQAQKDERALEFMKEADAAGFRGAGVHEYLMQFTTKGESAKAVEFVEELYPSFTRINKINCLRVIATGWAREGQLDKAMECLSKFSDEDFPVSIPLYRKLLEEAGHAGEHEIILRILRHWQSEIKAVNGRVRASKRDKRHLYLHVLSRSNSWKTRAFIVQMMQEEEIDVPEDVVSAEMKDFLKFDNQ